MSRHLAILERRVPEGQRASFLELAKVRRESAEAQSAKYWVYQHTDDNERYIEFVEGADATLVMRLAGVNGETIWRQVEVR